MPSVFSSQIWFISSTARLISSEATRCCSAVAATEAITAELAEGRAYGFHKCFARSIGQVVVLFTAMTERPTSSTLPLAECCTALVPAPTS